MTKMKLANIKCQKCGSVNYELKDKGPHKGAYCKMCGAWIKWVGPASSISSHIIIDELVSDVQDDDKDTPW